jgi:hypothetical protein
MTQFAIVLKRVNQHVETVTFCKTNGDVDAQCLVKQIGASRGMKDLRLKTLTRQLGDLLDVHTATRKALATARSERDISLQELQASQSRAEALQAELVSAQEQTSGEVKLFQYLRSVESFAWRWLCCFAICLSLARHGLPNARVTLC